jgi:hypothetical protein
MARPAFNPTSVGASDGTASLRSAGHGELKEVGGARSRLSGFGTRHLAISMILEIQTIFIYCVPNELDAFHREAASGLAESD